MHKVFWEEIFMKNEKMPYEKAEAEVIVFDEKDIITMSPIDNVDDAFIE